MWDYLGTICKRQRIHPVSSLWHRERRSIKKVLRVRQNGRTVLQCSNYVCSLKNWMLDNDFPHCYTTGKFKSSHCQYADWCKAFSLWGEEYSTSYCLIHKAAFTAAHLPGLRCIIHCQIMGVRELKGKEKNGWKSPDPLLHRWNIRVPASGYWKLTLIAIQIPTTHIHLNISHFWLINQCKI